MDTNLLQHLLRKTANQVFNVLSLLLAEVGVLHHSCGGGGADHQVVQNIILDCDVAVVQDLLKVHHLYQTKIVPIPQKSETLLESYSLGEQRDKTVLEREAADCF